MSRRAGFLVVTLGAHRTNNGEYLINQSVVTCQCISLDEKRRREGRYTEQRQDKKEAKQGVKEAADRRKKTQTESI